ncbi:MAG TPA: arsenate reductase ArsC [bacterium]|nr:arsenate reductase ArsC [bacterium]
MTRQRSMKILFVCTGNSCRSQMAEGFARAMLPDGWKAMSAGTIAAGVHPLAIEAMKEEGIDISGQRSKSLKEIPRSEIDRVVTLCGDAHEHCPIFPNAKSVEHWPIEDPVYATASPDPMPVFRRARDDIKKRMSELADRLL